MKLQKMDFGLTLTKLVNTKKGENQLQKIVIITLKSQKKRKLLWECLFSMISLLSMIRFFKMTCS